MYYDTIMIPNAERSFFDKYILRNQNGKLKNMLQQTFESKIWQRNRTLRKNRVVATVGRKLLYLDYITVRFMS